MSTPNHQISKLEEKYNFRKALYPLLHVVFALIILLCTFSLKNTLSLPPHLTPGAGGYYMPIIGLVTSVMGIMWFAWDQWSMRDALENMRAIQRDLKHNKQGERYASLSIQRTVIRRSLHTRRALQLIVGIPGALFCMSAIGAFFAGFILTAQQSIYMGLIMWLTTAFYGVIGYWMTRAAWNLPKTQRQELGRINDELDIIQLTQKAKPGDMSIAAEATSGGQLTDVTHAQSGQLTDAQHQTTDEVVLDFEEEEAPKQHAVNANGEHSS